MIPSAHQAYQRNQAQTASPDKLLIMLYDGAIRFVKQGMEGIDQRNIEKANTNLIKAQAILHELIGTLNFDYPISKQLASVYEYMLHQLIQANIKKDKKPADEVLQYLQDLKDTWVQATQLAKTQPLNSASAAGVQHG